MNLLSRTYLGLDIRRQELCGVALRRSGKRMQLAGARRLPLAAGQIQPGFREPNIPQLPEFVSQLRELMGPLAGKEERVALSLPDNSGRLLLHEVETPFKSKTEGIDVLCWQLRHLLPESPQDVRLDYQILSREESGRYRLAVSAISRRVLDQYQDALEMAGLHAMVIDFHACHLYNYYQSLLDLGDDFILVGVDGQSMTLQYFQNHQLALHRSREIDFDPQRVFQEVNRSLAGSRETHPGLPRAKVFLHSDWDERDALLQALGGAFEKEVFLLDPKLTELVAAGSSSPDRKLQGLVAAVGAAARMM